MFTETLLYSAESNTDDSSDLLRPIGIFSMHSCSVTGCFLDLIPSLLRERFLFDHFTFFKSFFLMYCNFLLLLNMPNRRHDVLALLVLKPTKQINCQKTKFALTCSFQKVFRALAFSTVVVKNSAIHFISKFLV